MIHLVTGVPSPGILPITGLKLSSDTSRSVVLMRCMFRSCELLWYMLRGFNWVLARTFWKKTDGWEGRGSKSGHCLGLLDSLFSIFRPFQPLSFTNADSGARNAAAFEFSIDNPEFSCEAFQSYEKRGTTLSEWAVYGWTNGRVVTGPKDQMANLRGGGLSHGILGRIIKSGITDAMVLTFRLHNCNLISSTTKRERKTEKGCGGNRTRAEGNKLVGRTRHLRPVSPFDRDRSSLSFLALVFLPMQVRRMLLQDGQAECGHQQNESEPHLELRWHPGPRCPIAWLHMWVNVGEMCCLCLWNMSSWLISWIWVELTWHQATPPIYSLAGNAAIMPIEIRVHTRNDRCWGGVTRSSRVYRYRGRPDDSLQECYSSSCGCYAARTWRT